MNLKAQGLNFLAIAKTLGTSWIGVYRALKS